MMSKDKSRLVINCSIFSPFAVSDDMLECVRLKLEEMSILLDILWISCKLQ